MSFNKRCISKEEFKKYEDSDVAYALYVRDNLKPNDYFRTFNGQIFRSMNISPIKDNKILYANGDYNWVDILAVTNFSDKLIDLIDKGDYVNGYKVLWVYNTEIAKSGPLYVVIDNHDDGLSRIMEEDIKDIVTKEQFNSMKYEVGE